MKQRTQTLTDFIQKEQFELTEYITHLFDYYKNKFEKDHTQNNNSYQPINIGQS